MAEESVPIESRRFAFSMCHDMVGGIWSEVDEETFQIKILSGGLTNYLFTCSLSSDVNVPAMQPKSVVVRKYGEIATNKSVLQDTVISALLSEKQIGPKLYGMTLEGRAEEYIQADPLSTTDLHNPTLSRMIAEKLAMLHALDMPVCKEPIFLYDTMDNWLLEVQDVLNKTPSDKDKHYMQLFKNYNLEEELQTLKTILSGVDSPVVFSHNDLQEGNILYNEKFEDTRKRMTVIDWEYSGYNYRGYDFGNHFLEWCYNYNVTEYPCFSYNEHDYPTREQQYEFFKAYLAASGSDSDNRRLDGMYREANTFALASHFLWGLWAVLQNDTSNIAFGFLEYADNRFRGYFKMKQNGTYTHYRRE